MGLRNLRESNPRDYWRVIENIAEAIAEMAETTQVNPCDPGLFTDLRNVFVDERPR